MNRYLYQVGDQVRHDDHPEIVGTIIELNTEVDGVPITKLDIDNPWYHIEWDDPRGKWVGWEHQSRLLPHFVNIKPLQFMELICRTNRSLWESTLKSIEETEE